MADFLSTAIKRSNDTDFFRKFILHQQQNIGTCKKCKQQQETEPPLLFSHIKLHKNRVSKQNSTITAMIRDYFKFQTTSDNISCKGCKKHGTMEGFRQLHGKFHT